MAATGIGMFILSGAGAIVFGSAAGPLPDFWRHQPRIEHWIGARLMLGLLALHVSAALYHHFILRDCLIRRILPGRP
jgi:cytochrome b561